MLDERNLDWLADELLKLHHDEYWYIHIINKSKRQWCSPGNESCQALNIWTRWPMKRVTNTGTWYSTISKKIQYFFLKKLKNLKNESYYECNTKVVLHSSLTSRYNEERRKAKNRTDDLARDWPRSGGDEVRSHSSKDYNWLARNLRRQWLLQLDCTKLRTH